MNNVRRMNDLVAVGLRHMKLMKLNVLSIKNCCSTCGAPLRTTEVTIPEHHLNEVIHTATDERNWLFTPLLGRLWFVAIRGDLWRFAAIRGDLLISDTLSKVIATRAEQSLSDRVSQYLEQF